MSMGGVTPETRTIERVMRRKSKGGDGGDGGDAGWDGTGGTPGTPGTNGAGRQPAEIFTSGLRRILSWSYTTKAMAMLGMILT